MNDKDRYFFDGLKNGDSAAIREILKEYSSYARSYTMGNSGTREDGYELLNDTLTEIWRWLNRDSTFINTAFDAVIKRFMRNIWLKELRRRKGVNEIPLREISEIPPSNDCEETCYELFKKGISRLRERCREIIDLYFQGIPANEAFVLLKMDSANAYNQAFFVCRNNLRDFIEKNQVHTECNCLNK